MKPYENWGNESLTLRQLIGDCGRNPVKVRPITRNFKQVFIDGEIEPFAIIDSEGWRRELYPLEIERQETDIFKRRVFFKRLKPDFDCYAAGLAFRTPRGEWVINHFELAPIEAGQELELKYTLDKSPELEAYVPWEDVEDAIAEEF